MKKRFIVLFLTFIFVLCAMTVSAETNNGIPYSTYTFSYDGDVLLSPHAYIPQKTCFATDIGLYSLRGAKDIKSDKDGKLYVADTAHNRIVILNNDLSLNRIISEYDYKGKKQTFKNPMGLFVTDEGHLYVSDTENAKIIEYDKNDKVIRVIGKPNSTLLPEMYNFAPSYIAVDNAGRMYVISEQTTYGIMVFNKDGGFVSFLGANKTTPSLSDIIWRKFMTKAQLSELNKILPTDYSNLTVDEKGFVYATSIVADDYYAFSAINARSKDSTYAMLKKFNLSADEVLKRLGYYPPAGDISAKDFSYTTATVVGNQDGASQMIGVALGTNNTYTLFDKKRNKIFTYDAEGNLLYAFGGTGSQYGLFTQISNGCYVGEDLYVLDGGQGQITRFTRTEYGALLHETIEYNNNREYEKSVENWKKVLKQNNSLTVANIGLGRAEMRLGNYKEAMNYLKKAHDVEDYGKAFTYYRDDLLKKGWIFAIPIVLIVLAVLLSVSSKKIRAYVMKPMPADHKLRYRILYSNYQIFHPFNGYWEIKKEGKGSLGAALVLFVCAAVSMIIKDLTTGYLIDPSEAKDYNIITHFLAIILIAALFCVANWCLTSLMNGKGSLKDIAIMVGYSVTPLIFVCIPAGLISNILSASESGIYTAILMIGYVWCGILLFVGNLTIHEYSLGKNVLSLLLIALGMIIILFIGILGINLLGRIESFIVNIYNELILRW